MFAHLRWFHRGVGTKLQPLAALLVAAGVASCGGSAQLQGELVVEAGLEMPPSHNPDWRDMETGQACVAARVACAPGNCAANLTNTCRRPVTCEFTVQCVCEAYTGESGEALGFAKETLPPGERAGILARVVCSDGDVVATLAQHLDCE